MNLTNAVWSRFRYHRPDGKDIRLNVHRFWRNDGQAVVDALTTQAQAPTPTAIPPPPPQAGESQP